MKKFEVINPDGERVEPDWIEFHMGPAVPRDEMIHVQPNVWMAKPHVDELVTQVQRLKAAAAKRKQRYPRR